MKLASDLVEGGGLDLCGDLQTCADSGLSFSCPCQMRVMDRVEQAELEGVASMVGHSRPIQSEKWVCRCLHGACLWGHEYHLECHL